MKKVILALSVFSAGVVSAADVSVSHVRDYNLDRNGVRVEATLPQVMSVVPTASVTYVDDQYTRYGVGSSVQLFSAGSVKVNAVASGVFQDTKVGDNGFGLTVGVKASVPLASSVDLTAGVERFVGHSRVDAFNGTMGTVGLSVKF